MTRYQRTRSFEKKHGLPPEAKRAKNTRAVEAKPMAELKLLTDRIINFPPYADINITANLQAQAELTAKEKDKEWAEWLGQRVSIRTVPRSNKISYTVKLTEEEVALFQQLRKQIEGE